MIKRVAEGLAPPPQLPEHRKQNMSDRRLLEKVRKMNEDDAAAKKSSEDVPFDYFSEKQKDDYASGIEDIVFLIVKMKETNAKLNKTMRVQRMKETGRQNRQKRLLLSKPAKHMNKWCSSTHLSAELMSQLSLPTDCDASSNIYSPWRDLPRTKEGQAKMAREQLVPFKPGETGKMFGESPISSCSESYQLMLERHLKRAVDNVKSEYATMPWGTVSHSKLKGNVGRDLAALEKRLKRCQSSISFHK